MAFALIGIGIPGSGKSTVLRAAAARNNLVYINRDDVREELFGSATDRSNQILVHTTADEQAIRAIMEGKSVVYDATFAEPEKRKALTSLLHTAGATDVVGVWFSTPLITALRRNATRERIVPDAAIAAMFETLTEHPPSTTDGFTELFAGDDEKFTILQ